MSSQLPHVLKHTSRRPSRNCEVIHLTSPGHVATLHISHAGAHASNLISPFILAFVPATVAFQHDGQHHPSVRKNISPSAAANVSVCVLAEAMAIKDQGEMLLSEFSGTDQQYLRALQKDLRRVNNGACRSDSKAAEMRVKKARRVTLAGLHSHNDNSVPLSSTVLASVSLTKSSQTLCFVVVCCTRKLFVEVPHPHAQCTETIQRVTIACAF
jgi:hypothetical protein